MKTPKKADLLVTLKEASAKIDELQESLKVAKGETPKPDFLYYTYSIGASVIEDDYVPNYIRWLDFMSRTDLTDAELLEKAYAKFAVAQQAALTFDKKRPHRGVVSKMKLCGFTIKRLGRRPWALTWFAHVTYRDGRSNAELISSFHDYVGEYRWMQDRTAEEVKEDYGQEMVCLMGAEDMWRWQLCECKNCEDSDLVTITH